MSTPVVVGNYLFCVDRFLYCLDINNGLREIWRMRDPALGDYASIIASDDRILVIGNGELILMPADGSREIISRLRVMDENTELYSHPAYVSGRLYLRGENKLKAIRLENGNNLN